MKFIGFQIGKLHIYQANMNTSVEVRRPCNRLFLVKFCMSKLKVHCNWSSKRQNV